MGEFYATMERLNKVLVENGFAKAEPGILSPGAGLEEWYSCEQIPLRFDKQGKFIKPKNGEYV
jgi:hypothetical protein